MLMFIGGDGYAIGAAANKYAKRSLAVFDRRSNRVGKVGVINRIGRICAEVFYGKTLGLQKINNSGFVCIAGMVGTYGNRLRCIKHSFHCDEFVQM